MAYEYPLPSGPVDRATANLYLQAAWRRYEAEQNRLNQAAAYRAKQPNFADQFVTSGLKYLDDYLQEESKNRLADRQSERLRANKAYEVELEDATKRNYLNYDLDTKYQDRLRGYEDIGRARQAYQQGVPEGYRSPMGEPLLGMDARDVGTLLKEGMPSTVQEATYDASKIQKRGAETGLIEAKTGLTGLQADLAAQRLQWAPEQHVQEMERRAQQIELLKQEAQLKGDRRLLIQAQTFEQQTENEIIDYLRTNGEKLTASPHILSMYQSIAGRRDSRLRPQEIETNAYAARYGQNQADRDMPRPQRPSGGGNSLERKVEAIKQMYRLGIQIGKVSPMSDDEIHYRALRDATLGMDSVIRMIFGMKDLQQDMGGGATPRPTEKGGPVIPGLGSPGR